MSTTTDTAPITIHIPTPLRAYTDEQATATVEAATVGAALRALVDHYPELDANLYTDDGTLRSFVNIYLGDEDIRHLDGPDTVLEAGDELSIVPSIAGGHVD